MSPNPVEIWIQRPRHTHTEKATEGEGRDLVMRLRAKDPRGGRRPLGAGRGACRRVSLAVPGPATVWTSRLMNCEMVHFLCLSSLVCGTVLR